MAPLAIASAVNSDTGQAMRILRFASDAIRARTPVGRHAKTHQPTPEEPLYVLQIDGTAAVTGGNRDARQLLGSIVRSCSFAGWAVILTMPRPVVAALGGATSMANIDLAVLGSIAGPAGRGAYVPGPGSYGAGKPGVFAISDLPYDGICQRGRTFYWGDDGSGVQRIVAERLRARPPHLLEPALAGLHAQ